MAEEVLRIRIDGSGGGGGGGGSGGGGGGGGSGGGRSSSTDPFAEIARVMAQVDRAKLRRQIRDIYDPPHVASLGERADAYLAKEREKELLKEEIAARRPTTLLPPPDVIAVPDAEAEAKENIEKQIHRQKVKAWENRLARPVIPVFDPESRAAENIKARKEAQQIAAEEKKQVPDVIRVKSFFEEIGDLHKVIGRKMGGKALGGIFDALGMMGKGGGAGMAAAAGPAGAIMAALEALKALRDGINSTITGFAEFGRRVLNPEADPAQSVATMGMAVKSASDAFMNISPVVSIFGSAVGTAIEALGGFMGTIDGFVSRYAGYTPALAMAQAQASITHVMGEFRRARQATPELVRYIQVRTEMQQRFEDLKVRLLVAMAPLVTKGMLLVEKAFPILEIMVEMVSAMANMVPGLDEKLGDIRRQMSDPAQGAGGPGYSFPETDLMFPLPFYRPGDKPDRQGR